MSGRYGRRSSAPRVSRWMALRFAGVCKVCGCVVPAGVTAFYDYSARSVTCSVLACCEADGLTREVWVGSPVSGGWSTATAGSRLGEGYVRDPGEDMADRWGESL